jgi:hypothetical protein
MNGSAGGVIAGTGCTDEEKQLYSPKPTYAYPAFSQYDLVAVGDSLHWVGQAQD